MTPQVQNPARLRSPRIPGTFTEHLRIGALVKQVLRGRRRHSAAGLTHPNVVLNAAGYEVRTPHATKVLRRRRAKNAVAKQSRKVNR